MLRVPEGSLDAKQTPAETQVWTAVDEIGRPFFDGEEFVDDIDNSISAGIAPDLHLLENPSPLTVLAFEEVIEWGGDEAKLLAVRRLPQIIRSQVILGENSALEHNELDRLRDIWGNAMKQDGVIGEVAKAHYLSDERMSVRDITTHGWLANSVVVIEIEVKDCYSNEIYATGPKREKDRKERAAKLAA